MNKKAFRTQYSVARQLYHCREADCNWGAVIDPRVLSTISPPADPLATRMSQSLLSWSCVKFSYGN
jgi:hypothetical protein